MIFISAGHSNTDTGAVNPRLNLKEAELAVKLRNAILHYLNEADVPCMADGDGQNNAPLREAVKLVGKAVYAVEIHFNAAEARSAMGVEALADEVDKPLCQKLCQAIVGVTGSKLRGDKGFKPQNAGQHHRLAFVQAGGIVLEVEFISNDEAMKVYNDKYWLVAKAIAKVLTEQFYSTK